MPQIRAIVRAAAKQDYRFSALVAGIVTSDAFKLQVARHEAPPATTQAALEADATAAAGEF